MTRFDVQKGKVVDAPVAPPVPAAKKPIGFSIARYEAQQKRRKQTLARKLLQLAFPNRQLTIEGDLCRVEPTVVERVIGISNYLSTLCDHVPADTWLKLPRTDRFDALDLLIPKEYHTQVPGGIVYQVRFKAGKPEWVFLNVAHSIGRCKLVPTALAARVF